jgi:acylpyruvate hydrolase
MPASDKIDDGQVTLLPPILRPGKIICVGLNYPPAPGFSGDKPPYPILFNKVASALTGHHGEVIIPKISTKVEYEGELAVIIGKYGKNIPLQEALNWVAGYSIANDIGASDIQARSSQWASGKMFDTFCPLGPAIVSTDELPASENLNITTYLNGKIVQDGWTGDMYYSVSELISYISTLTTLEPGDLILTGSPKCIGMQPDPRLSLIPGDTIEVKITGLGSLSNKVVQEDG